MHVCSIYRFMMWRRHSEALSREARIEADALEAARRANRKAEYLTAQVGRTHKRGIAKLGGCKIDPVVL